MDQTLVIVDITVEFRITDTLAVNYAACAIIKAAKAGVIEYAAFAKLRNAWISARAKGRRNADLGGLTWEQFNDATKEAYTAVCQASKDLCT